MEELNRKGALAKEASYRLGLMNAQMKNQALYAMAQALEEHSEMILAANETDMQHGREKGLEVSFLDRLQLNHKRIKDMADGLRAVAEWDDPVGKTDEAWLGAQDIEIHKVRVPLGVIGIIYEARPNVTADAAGLCLKTGNAVLLRGSGDAINSNKAIVKVLQEACEKSNIPSGAIQLVEDTSRACANEMMRLNQYLDVLIPRGGAGLIQSVLKNATVPVIETGVGNCHIYVDKTADFAMALDIIYNGKVQRPGVCNATETLLVNKEIAKEFLPLIQEKLQEVELRGCEKTREIIVCKEATVNDYEKEFHSLILAVKVVDDIEAALEHIRTYSSKHSEVIVTNDYKNSRMFTQMVDAACVYVNASSRFSDGFQFGFGAEIGISTQKLHARGPMGLNELTTYKYVIMGEGQVRK